MLELAAAAGQDGYFCLYISPALGVALLATLAAWARDRRRMRQELLALRWAQRQNVNGRVTRNSP